VKQALICTILFFACGRHESQLAAPEPSTGGPQGTVPANANASVRITEPVEGAKVAISEIVRGTTAFAGKNHYVVVIPEKEPGDYWVQRGPSAVSGGTWSGQAQFGEGDVGVGENYIIRCLVTSTTLPPGKLNMSAIPADAVFSPAVKVARGS